MLFLSFFPECSTSAVDWNEKMFSETSGQEKKRITHHKQGKYGIEAIQSLSEQKDTTLKHGFGKRQLTIKSFSYISIAPNARDKRARAQNHGVEWGGGMRLQSLIPDSSAWHWRCSQHRGNPSHSAIAATRLLSQKWQICK